MIEMMLAQAAKDIGIGAGSVTLLAIIGLLVKRGISGNFQIGGSNPKTLNDREEGRDQNLSDNRRDQIEKHLSQADKDTLFNRDLCNLRHEQIEKNMVISEARIDRLDEKIADGFSGVYSRLDRITYHLLDDKNK